MSMWNPRGVEDNCGFCAISYALQQQKGIFLNADQLYDQTMEKFHIEKRGNESPVPRTLIFPEPGLSETKWPETYRAFQGTMYTPAQYTIRSVGEEFGLEFHPGDKDLVNALIKFAFDARAGWTLDDFVKDRAQRPGARAPFAAQKAYIERELKGNWVIGSKAAKHYVNMSFTPGGKWELFDAQIGMSYDGKGMRAKMPSLELFDRVSTHR